jgi:stage IV sporulation protein B
LLIKQRIWLIALIGCSLFTSTAFGESPDLTNLKVIPGGQTIGVKLKSEGILIVGHHLVQTAEGEKQSPAQLSNLRRGDVILKLNGDRIKNMTQFADIVERAGQAGKSVNIEFRRNKERNQVRVSPVKDQTDGKYRLGIYIRDTAAGVGTLTFFAPKEGYYGALGHVISDVDTQQPIPVGEGEIVRSNVLSIEKSENGKPGEKHAQFWKENESIGTIEENTQFGIFGEMRENPQFGYSKKLLPVASIDEVKEGPAQIYTVLEGQKVEPFDITITNVSHQTKPELKGLIIKITDARLLKKTGGIVQGMSGSPIIQNGKLIGAVTHVFVNDPTSGYGCFVEWMLHDAEKVTAD